MASSPVRTGPTGGGGSTELEEGPPERRTPPRTTGGGGVPNKSKRGTKKKSALPGCVGPIRTKRSAAYELLGGAALYALCVFLPGLVGSAIRFYEGAATAGWPIRIAGRVRIGGGGARGGGGGGERGDRSLGAAAVPAEPPPSRSYYAGWAAGYLCGSSLLLSEMDVCVGRPSSSHPPYPSPRPASAAGGEGEGEGGGDPTPPRGHGVPGARMLLYGGGVRSDLCLVAALSLGMAAVRVLLVHLMVPRYLADPESLAAMVRCKSTHLLSSASYRFSPVRTVRTVRGSLTRRDGESSGGGDESSGFVVGEDLRGEDVPYAPYMGPDYGDDDDEGEGEDDDRPPWDLGPSPEPLPRPERAGSQGRPPARPASSPPPRTDAPHHRQAPKIDHDGDVPSSPPLYKLVRSRSSEAFTRALGHEDASPYPGLVPGVSPSASHARASSSSSSASPPSPRSVSRLFSAPRRATAAFRLLYCTASCAFALAAFRDADFWPVWVGGRAGSSTRRCWDLSGGVALGWVDGSGVALDADYDMRNAALRLFFLSQGSYQLHSLCFHVMSMALLMLYGGGGGGGGGDGGNDRGSGVGGGGKSGSGGSGGGRLVSMRSSTRSYLRPLGEHAVTLSLISGSYVFSGLRRLGAVGIFTLEVSSVPLQVLQISVNSPDGSGLRRPGFLWGLHRFVVVPVFLYCRFFVLPFVVWRSAAFESQAWLDQIEHALVPGSGLALYAFFNGMLAAVFALNVIFFRRLLFHPHLRRLFAREEEEEDYC